MDEKLFEVLRAELNILPACTHDTLGARQTWIGQKLAQSPSTIRKWGDNSIKLAASLIINGLGSSHASGKLRTALPESSATLEGGELIRICTVDDAGDFALPKIFELAASVDIYARSAVNLLNQYATQLTVIVQRGGRVRILTLEPHIFLGRYLYPLPGNGEAVFRRHVLSVGARIRYIKSLLGGAQGTFEFRTIQFIPQYGMTTAWKEEPALSQMVVQMNFLFTLTERDRPLERYS